MERIQRKRTKGWRIPEGVVFVGRPTKWGNPFRLNHGCIEFRPELCYPAECIIDPKGRKLTLGDVVDYYRQWMVGDLDPFITCQPPPDISELKGKDLACWCALDNSCHADILIKLLKS